MSEGTVTSTDNVILDVPILWLTFLPRIADRLGLSNIYTKENINKCVAVVLIAIGVVVICCGSCIELYEHLFTRNLQPY